MTTFRLRQSDLKMWMECPLKYHFTYIEGLPREQGGSAMFGSVIHDCVLWMEVNQDLEGAVERFKRLWLDPSQLDPTYRVDYYERGRSWKKFMEQGPKVLTDWWGIISWDSALTLAREHYFEVPIGDGHVLTGTVDKLEVSYHGDVDAQVLKISDYKTNAKAPTYDYLQDDLQFSAYSYATTRPEFWAGIGGQRAYETYRDLPRYGEWVQLGGTQGIKRMDAGPRTERHFNRIIMAANAMAESVGMRIFVPTISGASCRYCEFRKPCGLPQLDEEGNPIAGT